MAKKRIPMGLMHFMTLYNASPTMNIGGFRCHLSQIQVGKKMRTRRSTPIELQSGNVSLIGTSSTTKEIKWSAIKYYFNISILQHMIL